MPDIAWFNFDGEQMTEEDWDSRFGRAIAVFLNGQGIPDRDQRGQRVVDDSFLMCFNAHDQPIDFTVPGTDYAAAWEVVADTLDATGEGKLTTVPATGTITVGPRALIVLCRAD